MYITQGGEHFMLAEEKTQLINRLKDAHQVTADTVRDLDLGLVVHADSGWRVQDILGHLAQWYENRIRSMQAWQQGQEWQIPNYSSSASYNLQMAEERKDQPGSAVVASWKRAHTDFVALLEATSPEQFELDFMLPWGDYGPLTLLIERMIAHEEGHNQEILAVVKPVS
jgi:hypothetical protein